MNEIPAHFQVYKDAKGEWRWRLRAAGNSTTIADSGEGYSSRSACFKGMQLVSAVKPSPWIWDVGAEDWVKE